MTPRLIAERLAFICDAEEIDAEPAALSMLARAADGSMRDALSLLDQAIAYCGGRVEEDSVALMLGTIDRDHVLRVLQLLAADDAQGLVAAIRDIDEQFPDYARLLDDLARDLQRIAVYQVVGTCDSEDDLTEQEIAELALQLPAGDVQLFYQTALLGRRDLYLAPDPRSGIEMILLRMLAFRPAESRAPAAPAGNAGGDAQRRKKRRPTAAAPATPVESARAGDDVDWSELVTRLGLSGTERLLASNCAFLRREGQTIHLGLDARSESLLTKPRRDALASRLSEHYGEQLSVNIAVDRAVPETPLQEESRLADERLEAARKSLEADPNVQAMKNMFGAEIRPETIELVNPPQSD